MAQESIREMKKSVKGTMLLITLIMLAVIVINTVVGLAAQAKQAENTVKTMLADTLNGAYSQLQKGATYSGIPIGDLSVEDLNAMIQGNSCDTIILDASGKIIASYFLTGKPSQASYAEYAQKAGQTEFYTGSYGEKGIRRCYAAKAIETTGNTLIVGSPSGEYYSGLITSFWVNVVMVILIVVMIVAMNLFFSKVITAPLDKIRAKIIDMSRGNLSGDRLDMESDNDLGVLASSVNHLAESTRNIIGDIRRTAEEIAHENLRVKPSAQYEGDFLPVKTALEGIVDSMKSVVANVDAAGREVSVSSTQMSSNSTMLSQAAREGSDTVAELSDSLNKVHEQINHSTEKAALAKELTEKSVEAINEGNEKMTSMLAAMREINATSSKIANIIKTIQDISFQTNILSLNASIEAARAGAAGKGFAVVAGEVGSLAGKTAEAAKSTTKLIETSLKAVEHGMVIANETADMLGMMAEKANESAEVVEQISRASTEQAESIRQTIDGMDRISASVAQVNVAAQDCEQTSTTLASQSAMLEKTISHFTVDAHDLQKRSSAPPPAPSPAPKYEPAPAPAPKPEAKPEQKFTPKPAPAAKPAAKPAPKIELPDDNKPAPAAKPAAPAPKPAAKPAAPAKSALKIELPDDNKPAAKPAPKPAPAPAASSPRPKISLPDDDASSSAPVGAPIKKATMTPVTRSVRMDPDKY